MRIFLSFDDGRDDFYFNSFKVLKKYNLKASFHITTGFIDGTFKTDKFGINRKPLTPIQIREMFNYGMDISSHGDRHIMENKDFITSIKKLKNMGINTELIGFSIPNSKFTETEKEDFYLNNKSILKYIRVGRNKKCYTFFRKIAYIFYRFTKINVFYNYFNYPNIQSNDDPLSINSIVIKKYTKLNSITKLISKYKYTNKNIVFMFHSIVKNPTNTWEWDLSNFEKLCIYLKNNDFCVETLSNF